MAFCKVGLIVANTGSDSLSIIDLKQRHVKDTILLNHMIKDIKNKNVYINGTHIGPHSIYLDKDKDVIYTVNSYHNSVIKINIQKWIIEDLVYVGSSPSHMVLNGDTIYVSNSDSNSISIIDRNNFQLIGNIPVGEKPHDIKVDNSLKRIYVANNDSHSIHVVFLENLIQKEIRLDCNPLHLYISSQYLYALCSQVNGISKSSIIVIDKKNESIVNKIDIEGSFIDMVVLEKKGIVYTTNIEDGFIYKININKNEILCKYFIGGMPNILLWDNNNLIYITNASKNIITVFDISKKDIIDNIKVGQEPSGMIFI
jgi:YVTN family beta-propeller protein